MFELKEIQAKSILSPCGIPGIDWTINPYIGCAFACKYCYASFMGRAVKKEVKDWGTFVFAKTNAPELLKQELPRKLKNKGRGQEIFISSVTDPYQGVEAKYKLTRRCLEALVDFDFRGTVSILTKSNLVLRDRDLFKKLKNVAGGLTVTSTDDGISRYFEKFAPPVSQRFEALKTLNRERIKTYAFVGPLLPHFVARRDELEKIFKKLRAVGVKDVFVENINLAAYIRQRLWNEMNGSDKELVKKFYLSQTKEYRQELDRIVKSLVKKYGLNLMLDLVIQHREFQKQPPKSLRRIDKLLSP
ncbi:MAG: radical SAM protein [Candidatus Nealsonbacteria bacterium]|nr:radical SAM protein [Candidatus Nealsonbacteria bacterium]